MKAIFNYKIPVFWVLILAIGAFLIMSSFVLRKQQETNKGDVNNQTAAAYSGDCAVNMDQIRERRSPYIRPLLLTDVMVQDRAMAPLKSELEQYIHQKINDGTIQNMSVYIRKMDNGAHISVNENDLYNPASLMKVAYLITYLEEAELRPGLLQKSIYFDKHFTAGNSQNIVDFTLKEKSFYTIAQLLEAMIKYSDNDATALLMQNLNNDAFRKLFKNLQLPAPPLQGEYFIGPADYAKFFRVIYSSTYLNKESSEYAIRLLLQSTFREGICSTLDPSIPVAHKFGERILNNIAQLHEFGIVYYNDSPYLIGIMSKSNNLQSLKLCFGEISSKVLRYMQSNS